MCVPQKEKALFPDSRTPTLQGILYVAARTGCQGTSKKNSLPPQGADAVDSKAAYEDLKPDSGQ